LGILVGGHRRVRLGRGGGGGGWRAGGRPQRARGWGEKGLAGGGVGGRGGGGGGENALQADRAPPQESGVGLPGPRGGRREVAIAELVAEEEDELEAARRRDVARAQ